MNKFKLEEIFNYLMVSEQPSNRNHWGKKPTQLCFKTELDQFIKETMDRYKPESQHVSQGDPRAISIHCSFSQFPNPKMLWTFSSRSWCLECMTVAAKGTNPEWLNGHISGVEACR